MLYVILSLVACSPSTVDEWSFLSPEQAPEPLAVGPQSEFATGELFQGCAWLTGGEEDLDYHNLVMPYRGHLVMPWAAEWGVGGLSVFDMSDPCDPVRIADSFHPNMRETHAIGFVHVDRGEHAGDYAVVNGTKGIVIWDLTDVEAIEATAYLEIQDVFWPDAYARVSFSVFWQYPYIYVAAADNGLIVIDATDPADPFEVNRLQLEPPIRAGGVFVHGDRALIVSAEQQEAAMLDLADPVSPQLFPGGRFVITDGEGTPREAYAGNLRGDVALFARKEGGGGPIAYDVSNPSQPTFLGDYPMTGVSGGYIFFHEDHLFMGQSNQTDVFKADLWSDIQHVGTATIEGDQDTLTPFGNVAILSADDDAEDGQSSAVVPWIEAPDTRGPEVVSTIPRAGQRDVLSTSRLGVAFNELIDPASVYPGSLQLTDTSGAPVPGWAGAQEALAWYAPYEALEPGVYELRVVEGGIRDASGNPVATDTRISFVVP